MRLGTTSYIYRADILENVRKLADRVDDVELVIFESPAPHEQYPDGPTIQELCRIASDKSLTYTVHLPLDLRLAEDRNSLDTALRVMESTQDLNPWGYIVHMEGNVRADPRAMERWADRANMALERMSLAVGSSTLLCVENLENQTPEMMDHLLDRIPVSCCIDVGHLWKQRRDPVPWVEAWLSRARVIHIHGVGTRDHKGLSLVSPIRLDPVVNLLIQRFQGVLTFEVFNESDFFDCQEAFEQSVERLCSLGGCIET